MATVPALAHAPDIPRTVCNCHSGGRIGISFLPALARKHPGPGSALDRPAVYIGHNLLDAKVAPSRRPADWACLRHKTANGIAAGLGFALARAGIRCRHPGRTDPHSAHVALAVWHSQ